MNGGVIVTGTDQLSEPNTPAPKGDLLRFLDGSEIHGELSSIQSNQVVGWLHPDARKEIQFRPDNLDCILFAHSAPLSLKPTCRIHFVNGDDLFADLVSMDAQQIEVTTWFGGTTKVPRSALQSITFLSQNFALAYEGPQSEEGWNLNPPSAWQYRDGSLICRAGGGVMSRDFGLTNSCTIDFDVSFADVFGLLINLYTDKQTFDYGGDYYCLMLTSATVDLRRNAPNSATGGSLGTAAMPEGSLKNKLHVTIQCNRAERTISVFIDKQLVRRWKDSQEFAGKGTRLLFTDISGRPGLALSNIRVSRWEEIEPEIPLLTRTSADAVSFINRDKASGKITALTNGKLGLLLGTRQLEIPLQRITQIDFAFTNAPSFAAGSREVRASLTGGGQLSFELVRWDRDKISARSALFGMFDLQPQSIRQIDFNLGRPKLKAEPASKDEFGGLDD